MSALQYNVLAPNEVAEPNSSSFLSLDPLLSECAAAVIQGGVQGGLVEYRGGTLLVLYDLRDHISKEALSFDGCSFR